MQKLNAMLTPLTPLIVFGCLAITQPVQAASFDCAKASTNIEKIVCADAALSKLDEELNAVYKAALRDDRQANSVKQAQRLWVERRNYCNDVTCAKLAYQSQLALLKSLSSILLTPPVDKYINDYLRDLNARTYPPAHVDRQEGEPYKPARDPNVCSLFLQNLQYFSRRNIPMSCGQPIAPGLEKHIQKVEWEDLDPDQYADLFRENVKESYGRRDPTEQNLAKIRESIRSKKGIFRRAKLDLRGQPSFEYVHGAKLAEAKFELVQYGINYIDQNNPRCSTQLRRAIEYGDTPGMYIATADLLKLYWNSIARYHGQYLWLINNHLYSEHDDADGTVQLSELRVESPIHFEPVCLYHYKTNLMTSGEQK